MANFIIYGELHYLWRAVDHEGEVLEVFVTKRRNRIAALTFLKKAMKRYGRPKQIVTDKLASYGAAMKVIGNADKQDTSRWENNRCENFHLLFRRRDALARFRKHRFQGLYAMLHFRDMGGLQKFVSIHSSVYNHFNHQRHLVSRQKFKQDRSASLAEWQ